MLSKDLYVRRAWRWFYKNRNMLPWYSNKHNKVLCLTDTSLYIHVPTRVIRRYLSVIMTSCGCCVHKFCFDFKIIGSNANYYFGPAFHRQFCLHYKTIHSSGNCEVCHPVHRQSCFHNKIKRPSCSQVASVHTQMLLFWYVWLVWDLCV